jgi:hypothetical protein
LTGINDGRGAAAFDSEALEARYGQEDSMNAHPYLAAAAVLAAGTALAEGPPELPYTGIQASFANINIDDFDNDAEGFELGGSADLWRGVFVLASYSTAKTDDFRVGPLVGSIEVSGTSLGIGYHYALNPRLDLVPVVSWLDAEARFEGDFSALFADQDDTGWSASVGLRALVTPSVELFGAVDRTDLYDDASTALLAGGVYYVTPHVGLGMSYEGADDSDTLLFTARAVF